MVTTTVKRERQLETFRTKATSSLTRSTSEQAGLSANHLLKIVVGITLQSKFIMFYINYHLHTYKTFSNILLVLQTTLEEIKITCLFQVLYRIEEKLLL